MTEIGESAAIALACPACLVVLFTIPCQHCMAASRGLHRLTPSLQGWRLGPSKFKLWAAAPAVTKQYV